MTDLLLDVENLSKTYRVRTRWGGHEAITAIDGISFQLARGESLGIVGESGSGKSTTVRILAGLEDPTEGSILLEGERWSPPRSAREMRRFARRVQMVFQDPFGSIDPKQTLEDAIIEVLAVHFPGDRAWRRRRVIELLEHVGLDERLAKAHPGRLSGGQRQRFAIARALALEPELLILDEAVSALDVSVQAQILNLLVDIRSSVDISILFVSHDLAVVRQTTDRCLVMKDGLVVESSSTSDVLDRPKHPYTESLLDAIPRAGWKPERRSVTPC